MGIFDGTEVRFDLLHFLSVPSMTRITSCAKPTRIRSGWPGQGLAKHIWSGSEPVCRNHLARNCPATSFPTFRLSSVLPPTYRIILCKTSPGSDLILADCVRFWPNGSGPEASRCAGNIRSASGQCFPADPDRMRIESGMFTGFCRV